LWTKIQFGYQKKKKMYTDFEFAKKCKNITKKVIGKKNFGA
jgi:hypothetical protein